MSEQTTDPSAAVDDASATLSALRSDPASSQMERLLMSAYRRGFRHGRAVVMNRILRAADAK